MHVVIIAAASHPLREPFAGGLESLTWELVRGLRRRGVDVTLFAGPGSDPDLGAREVVVRPLVLSEAARGDVSMPPERWLREHHAYLQVMLELQSRGDIDVIHNNSLHYLPIALAATSRAPMVTTLHTPPTPWLEPAIGLMDQARARFVAVSARTAGQWAHVAPAEVIHNGVDCERWSAGPGGEDLVWFGRLVPEKAPHEAVAIAAASGRRVRLAGPIANEAYFAEVVRPRWARGPSTWVTSKGVPSGSWSAPAPPPWSHRRGRSRTAWWPRSRWPAAHPCSPTTAAASASSSARSAGSWSPEGTCRLRPQLSSRSSRRTGAPAATVPCSTARSSG